MMMQRCLALALLIFALAADASAQRLVSPAIGGERVPDNVLLSIVKAEDARDAALVVPMLKDANAAVRFRAALAAGRIGDDSAVGPLEALLRDASTDVRAMAAFALGEIESAAAADAVLAAMRYERDPAVKARLVEAAGKIAAANSKAPAAKPLGEAVLDALESEAEKGRRQHRETILLALTAALRARPEEAGIVAARFLTNLDPRVRADAANTLTRLRAKNANAALRTMLLTDTDPIARANAARALGAAEDRDAVGLLTDVAIEDQDLRVRVSAIRSMISLLDAGAAGKLIDRGRELMKAYASRRREVDGPEQVLPAEKNELLEIAAALGRLLANTKHQAAWKFLEEFRYADKHYSPEIEVAMARIDPEKFLTVSNIGGAHLSRRTGRLTYDWRVANSLFGALSEYAAISAESPLKEARSLARKKIEDFIDDPLREFPKADPVTTYPAIASALDALARFKPDDLGAVLLENLNHEDVFVRASAARLLADHAPTSASRIRLEQAFKKALITDKNDNDAQLAMLDAMAKIDKAGAVDTLFMALDAPDYLVRKRAFELLEDPELIKKYPGAFAVVRNARMQNKHHVVPYDPKTGTRLGQVLNTEADYRRALSRRNGAAAAVITTQKGSFTIDLLPEEAPLTVDNFIKLARAGFFNGLAVHRVVPNFVIQDGDPRGDGNGGPGWSIRCEINMVPYERGVVGMALSGKDTGGSQWFVTHSPQPHLDGGYTVFGRVGEKGMPVVDRIARGDRIISVRILERNTVVRRTGRPVRRR
jgi:cyclophilin family peptidyl-prolyl cis-trans isomerase/HEAT repeat protein